MSMPPLRPPHQERGDVSSSTDQCTSLQSLLAQRSFEPVSDLGQSQLSGDWSDELFEYEESCCECSFPGILESLNLNLD